MDPLASPLPAPATERRQQIQCLQKTCIIPQRFVLCIMGFFAIWSAYLMRLCLNIAITEMVRHNMTTPDHVGEDETCPDPNANSNGNTSHHEYLETFDWDEETQGLILSAFYWGYAITHIPGGMLSDRFGGKYMLGFGIFSSSVCTFVIPPAARAGVPWLIVTRVITGLGEGVTFPALSDLLARWVPLEERGFLGSLAYSGSLLGSAVGTILAGFLLDRYPGNWPMVFYVFGCIGLTWCVIWVPLCYSSPDNHPFIRDKEWSYLDRSVPRKEHGAMPPWKHILTSVPVWALVAAQIGHDWGFYTMVTDLPKYMKDVLKFAIQENTLLTAIPYLAMWLVTLSTGMIADCLISRKYMSVTGVRKLFTSIAHFGPALAMIAASYAGCDRVLVVVLFTVTMGLMGAFYPGMKVNSLDLSPNYAGSVMALVNGVGAFCGVFTPYLAGLLTSDRTLTQWRRVFWISSGINFFTIVIFLLFGSGNVQPWNYVGFEKKTEEIIINSKNA